MLHRVVLAALQMQDSKVTDDRRKPPPRASLRRPPRAAAVEEDTLLGDLADDLTEQEILELGERLRHSLAELEASLRQSAAGAQAVDLDQPIGRVSRIDAIQQQKMVQAQRARQRVRQEQVRAALAKIATDDYGVCQRCDDPIGYPRLKTRPETPLCMACQRALERR